MYKEVVLHAKKIIKPAYCLIISFGCMPFTNIIAQSPEIQWQNTIGGNKEDVINSCKQTPDGGFIIGATSRSDSSGDKSENNMGLSATTDYWIVKIDDAGNVQWENTIGGNKDDELYDVIPTADGGYLAAGFSYSGIGGDKTEARIGPPAYADYWVIKLDADGEIVWQNTIGGGFDDELYCVIENEDGSFYLGGQSSSEAGADKTENANAMDIWIVQINETGNIIWQTTIGGLQGDYLLAMKKTSDGGLILGCYSYSGAGADKSENTYGSYDYWIVKLDIAGNIEWENTIGGNNADYLNDIIEIPGGGYIAVGGSSSNASGEKSSNTFGTFDYYDYWVVKLDATGNLIWEKIYGGDGGDVSTCVSLLADGNMLIGGNSSSQISGNKTSNTFAFTIDIWIVKIDTNGNILWENSIGGDDFDYVMEMPLANDGGVVLGGFSYSGLSGDKTEANNGIADFADLWIIKNLPEVCPVPDGIYTDNITPNKATVHWANITGAENYQIWYRQEGIGTWIKKTSATNSKVLKSLFPATTYEYKIRTSCMDGNYSAFSPLQTFTTLPLRLENDVIGSYSVSPNPAGEKIIISGLLPVDGNLMIFDITGKKYFSLSFNNENAVEEINIQEFPAGIYYITIIQNNQAKTISFIH